MHDCMGLTEQQANKRARLTLICYRQLDSSCIFKFGMGPVMHVSMRDLQYYSPILQYTVPAHTVLKHLTKWLTE